MPEKTYREKEVGLYWRACQEARHGADRMAGYDELYCVAKFSDWPLLAQTAARALAEPAAVAEPRRKT